MLTPWSNAIKINENTELLSRPTILVMDRERGDVTVGQNVPFLTATEVTDGGKTIQQIQLSCGVLSFAPNVSTKSCVLL
ncbi:hypothetical protein ACFFUP_01955 [Vibrio ostreicida]|uniref:hypothetical protein n=1 Tax=Vibrio ostreicida TaxID=526588 RepID=UPI0014836A04|nr:hypothetical protein [Vibrio ostreicida]